MNRPAVPAILTGIARRYHCHFPSAPLSIKCMSNGWAHYRIDGGRFSVDESGYLLLNERQTYTVEIDAPTAVESFVVFFPDGWAGEAAWSQTRSASRLLDEPEAIPSDATHFFERLHPHDRLVSPQLARLRAAHRRGECADTLWLEEQLRGLLVSILRAQRMTQRETDALDFARPGTRHELYRRLHRARDFMHAKLGEPLTLACIARVASLSSCHFLRAFRKAFGRTPHAYLTELRLERAAFLLRRSDHRVTDICFDAGFQSLGSFSTRFHRRYGQPPRAFRATAQKGNFREVSAVPHG